MFPIASKYYLYFLPPRPRHSAVGDKGEVAIVIACLPGLSELDLTGLLGGPLGIRELNRMDGIDNVMIAGLPLYACLPIVALFFSWFAWMFGIRRFLRKHGVEPVTIKFLYNGTEIIEDATRLLDFCRGRRRLPTSFWVFLAGMTSTLLSLLALMLRVLVFGRL